jgi:hypothetical protein
MLAIVTDPPCGSVKSLNMLSTVAMAIISAHSTRVSIAVIVFLFIGYSSVN